MAVSSGAGNHPLCVAGCRHRCQLTRGDRHRRTGGVCSVQASGLLHARFCGQLPGDHGGFSVLPRGNPGHRLPHPPPPSPDADHGAGEDKLVSRRAGVSGVVRAILPNRWAGTVPLLPRHLFL